MNRLFIFCNGNHNEGFGHFSRCLALANILTQFRQTIRVKFIGDYVGYAVDRLKLDKFDFIQINEKTVFTGESLKQVNVMRATDVFLVDSYIAPQQFYDEMTLMSVKWGVIDDFATQDFSSASLVLNFRVGAADLFQYRSERSGLGPAYMPIRLEFLPVRVRNEQDTIKLAIKNILICIGGQDIHNISERLLERMLALFKHASVNLLLADQMEFRRLQNKYATQYRASINNFRPDIECVLETVDLLISGGGMLKYEACFCGIPNATISQSPDQQQDTVILEKEGLTLNLGLAKNFDLVQIASVLTGFSVAKRVAMRNKQFHTFPLDAHERLIGLFDDVFSE